MGDPPGGGEAAVPLPVETNPMGIGRRNWAAVERAAGEIIWMIQPTSVSEERRREVVDYIQGLIRNRLSVEVFPFGSVPLKTYLPDGDIDLTAFGGANAEDTLADDIKHVFKQEEKNMASEFVVKDVQLIRAEVKLVKCIVQDIVVDVSFNQIGGLCTLCFLEQVDHLIGKDHLFKRSIILIKAWCYYESRILGAHHGLISTYALETLVLYIFQFFHSTLDGPLAVLYKFLDYFSKFDWEAYCVSLNGPIRLSSLPHIVVDIPQDSDRDVLLSNDYLSSCIGLFSLPSRDSDKNPRGFQRKHLNVVDPLKEINNLGRSVSKGSFYRIRSAFSYGAGKLAHILLQPENSITVKLHKFFSNTMARHEGRQRPDVLGFEPSLVYWRPTSGLLIPGNSYDFDEDAGGDFLSRSGKFSQNLLNWPERTSSDNSANTELYRSSALNNSTVSLNQDRPSIPITLGSRFLEDSNKLATFRFGGLNISTDSSFCGTPLLNESASAVYVPYHVPCLYSSNSISNDVSIHNQNPDSDKLDKYEKKGASSLILSGSAWERVAAIGSLEKMQLVDGAEATASSKSTDPLWGSFSVDPTCIDFEQRTSSRTETSKSFIASDLTGDYNTFLHWLQYGTWCYEYGLSTRSLTISPLPTTLWDSLLPQSRLEQNRFSHRHYNNNGFHPSPAAYVLPSVALPGAAFPLEAVAKPRGTGTYFPYTAQPPRGYRPSSMNGRNHTSLAALRSLRDNGRNVIFTEANMADRNSLELSQPQVPIVMARIDNHPHWNGFPITNDAFIQPDGAVEFELAGKPSGSSPMLEKSRQETPVPSSPINLLGVRRSQPEQDR